MTQSPRMSAVETSTQVIVGLVISYAVTLYGLPLFGLHPSAHEAAWITAAYSVISWLRQYVIRRGFAGGFVAHKYEVR